MKRKAEEREKKAAEKATKVEELAKKRKMKRMAATSDAGHVPRKKTKTQQKLSRINLRNQELLPPVVRAQVRKLTPPVLHMLLNIH